VSAIAVNITKNEKPVQFHTLRLHQALRLQPAPTYLPIPASDAQEFPLRSLPTKARSQTTDHVHSIPSEELDTDVHLASPEDLSRRFHSDLTQGLTEAQVLQQRQVDGMNVLSPPPSTNAAWRLFVQLWQGFNIPLWIAALFAFLAYYVFGDPDKTVDIGLGIVLIIDVLINVVFNFYQEIKSIRIVRSFEHALPSVCTVIREGRTKQINISELVRGDVVTIKLGDKVPADLRLLQVNELDIDNSALTGESDPIHATTEHTSLNYLESGNLAFLSSLVVNGDGRGMVIHTGDDSVLGRVSLLTRLSTSMEVTSLHRETTASC
jgi:sodium/potassium-transporting ATPase subunit alpha